MGLFSFDDGEEEGSTSGGSALTVISFAFSVISFSWSLSEVYSGLRGWDARNATASNKRRAGRDTFHNPVYNANSSPSRFESEANADATQKELKRAAAAIPFKVGANVFVKKKKVECVGAVKWKGYNPHDDTLVVGVQLIDPKGDNNGFFKVTGVQLFKCEMNHGIFVTPNHLANMGTQDTSGEFVLAHSGLMVIQVDFRQELTFQISFIKKTLRVLCQSPSSAN